MRALVSAEPGSQISVFAAAGGHDAELLVLVVRHHASGWVREIARKDEDSHVEAEFEPESGIVTVYEGRREFKALERAARHAGLARSRVREYVPYRMLEVEVAANAVYWWAAERILERRLPGERPADLAEYAAAVRMEEQILRHRSHDKLMKAFLGPEVFEGTVAVAPPRSPASEQLRAHLRGAESSSMPAASDPPRRGDRPKAISLAMPRCRMRSLRAVLWPCGNRARPSSCPTHGRCERG